MTSSSFDFRFYLKNIFALEPPLKFASFVVEEVIYQNVKKKVKKFIPRRYNRRRRRRGLLHSKTSNDNLRSKNRFLAQF
jgi:hypothetical protein